MEQQTSFYTSTTRYNATLPSKPRKESAKMRTARLYNLHLVNQSSCAGKRGMPLLNPELVIPDSLIGFNYAKSASEKTGGVHFFLDDYQYERVWARMESYVEVLSRFDCVLTPDFSLYLDMPLRMQAWNIYRSRACGHYWQSEGIKVIPTISWSCEESYGFCFEGVPEGSVIAVSTVGVKRNADARYYWRAGMSEAIKRTKPACVLLYGGNIGYDFGDTPYKEYANQNVERMKTQKNRLQEQIEWKE